MELGPAGSLADLLHRSSLATLPWVTRVGLGAGVAVGIAFLHDQKPPIIHRDMKSANVVLDSALMPKLADFRSAILRAHAGLWCQTSDASIRPSFGILVGAQSHGEAGRVAHLQCVMQFVSSSAQLDAI